MWRFFLLMFVQDYNLIDKPSRLRFTFCEWWGGNAVSRIWRLDFSQVLPRSEVHLKFWFTNLVIHVKILVNLWSLDFSRVLPQPEVPSRRLLTEVPSRRLGTDWGFRGDNLGPGAPHTRNLLHLICGILPLILPWIYFIYLSPTSPQVAPHS